MDLHGVLRSISVYTPTCLALSLLWLAGCAGTILKLSSLTTVRRNAALP